MTTSSNFKKLLLAGTAIFAVGGFASAQALADQQVLTANTTWAVDGDQNSNPDDASGAAAGDAVDLLNFTLTVTDDGSADDGGGAGSYTLGAVTDIGTGNLLVTSNGAGGDVAATIASISIAGNVTVSNTDAHDATVSANVTGNATIGGDLALTNDDADAADTIAFDVDGNLEVTGTTTVTADLGTGTDGNSTLTVGGNATFTGSLDLDDNGGSAILVLDGGSNQLVTGAIDGVNDGDGTVTITNSGGTGTTFASAIGSANSLAQININATNTTAFSSTVDADDIDFGAAGTVTFADDVTSTSGIDFMNNAGTITFADDAGLTGTIDSTGGANGTVNFSGDSSVSGTIGATNALTAINLNGTSGQTVAFADTVAATSIDFGGTGAATFAESVTGGIDFMNNAGTVTFADGADLTGTIASTGGTAGTVNFSDTGTGTDISSTISGVSAINITGAGGDVEFDGTVSATTITISNTGTADFDADVTAAVNLSAAGTVDVAADADINGAVDNTTGGDGVGTLTVATTGATNTITGAVGSTNSLAQGNINGTGTLAFSSTVNIDDLDFGGAATATFANDVTSANGVDFMNNAGTITFADNADLTGNILSTGGANGTIDFSGTSTVTGQLGLAAGTGIAAININGASETVTVTSDVFGTALTTVATSTFSPGGDVTLTGAVTNGGTINLGVGDTLTAGSFGGAGTYNITLVDDGDGTLNAADFGSLASGGAIDLGAETVNFNITGNVANGTAVVLGTGGAGATSAGTVTDSSLIHTVTFAAAGNNHVLTVAQNTAGVATTTNNSNVGTVLDSLAGTTNTQLAAIQTSLATSTTAQQVDDILEATIPTVDAGAVVAGTSFVAGATDMTGTRLASLRDGSAESGMVAGNMARGMSFWGQVFGTSGDQDARDGVAGYEVDTYGMAVGADTRNIADDLVVGVGFGYANSDVDSKNANTTQTEVDSYQVALYAEKDLGDRTYMNGQVGYVYGDVDATRHNVGGTSGLNANADYDSNQMYARVEVGREYDMANGVGKGMVLTPKASANYMYYDADGYTETGAGGANLTVDSDSMSMFELGLGVDASWTMQTAAGGQLKPVLSAGVRHDLIGDEYETTSSFSGGGAGFKTKGFDPAQTTFDVGAGVTYYSTMNWELSADYDYEVKSDYDAHSGVVKATYKF